MFVSAANNLQRCCRLLALFPHIAASRGNPASSWSGFRLTLCLCVVQCACLCAWYKPSWSSQAPVPQKKKGKKRVSVILCNPVITFPLLPLWHNCLPTVIMLSLDIWKSLAAFLCFTATIITSTDTNTFFTLEKRGLWFKASWLRLVYIYRCCLTK